MTISRPAFVALRRSAFHALTKPYRTGALGVEFAAFEPPMTKRAARPFGRPQARGFFERHFVPGP